MAKTTQAPALDATIGAMPLTEYLRGILPQDFAFTTIQGVTPQLSDLTPAGLAYLLSYGMRQSMTDATAGLKKKLQDDGLPPAAVLDELHITAKTRAEKVLAGTVAVGAPRGPKAKGIEALAQEVAIGELSAKKITKPAKVSAPFTLGGKSWPNWNAFLAEYIQSPRNNPRIMAEAERRAAAIQDAGALNDILEDLL